MVLSTCEFKRQFDLFKSIVSIYMPPPLDRKKRKNREKRGESRGKRDKFATTKI